MKQRLAAILAADAVGFSRLMGTDERATVAELDANRELFRRHCEEHDGRIVDMAGDSVLAVFASVSLSLSYWNWYNFPAAFVLGELVTEVIGMFLAALFIAKVVPRAA